MGRLVHGLRVSANKKPALKKKEQKKTRNEQESNLRRTTAA
jgi:hypothetical protein